MRPEQAPLRHWTRRAFLFSSVMVRASGSHPPKGQVLAPDWRRYTDTATEFHVYRLTSPKYTSSLPAYYCRAISRRDRFLLLGSDRTGSTQVFRIDLKNGEWRQLTEGRDLDGSSICLLPDDRNFCYFDGRSLRRAELRNLRDREIYRIPDGWERCPGASVSEDGRYAIFGERKGEESRLRVVGISSHAAVRTVTEAPWVLSHPQMRPRRDQMLYRQGNEALWVVNLDGQQNRKLNLADGHIGPAIWSPNGKTLLYLNFPEDPRQLHTIREVTVDHHTDHLVAKTSQYAHFGCNEDTSVFVGASQNKSSPYILILLRITQRELTLCEHRASDARMVAPVFSPDSRRIFFNSDRDGKPAVYFINVDNFVEATKT